MTWHVRAENLFLMGLMEETLLVFEENSARQIAMLPKAVLTTVDPARSFDPHQNFMTAPTGPDGKAPAITEFLQAMLDAAWKRGLRPSGFEGPQEIAAVRAHLSDMRKLAMGDKA